ncbi:MAG TPA: hypothetical protein VF623_10345 [Segetibacter sp.]
MCPITFGSDERINWYTGTGLKMLVRRISGVVFEDLKGKVELS